MAIGLKTYDEFSVKKDSSDYLIIKKDGTPELGERIKEVRLDEATVSLLNANWKNFMKYYVLKDETVKQIKPIEVTKLEVPEPPAPTNFNLLVEKDLAELTLILESDVEFQDKIDTMTKQRLVDVMNRLGIEHDTKEFAKTKKDTYALSVRTFLKEQKIQDHAN